MESKQVQRLKLAIRPLAFNLFLCLFTTVLFLAMTPAIGSAQLNPLIFAVDGGFPPCDIGCWSPDGESTPDDVRSSTAFVGDVVQWGHSASVGNPFSVTASTTQGDYLGHTCPEPGGLNGYLANHDNFYHHTFIQPQDCGYRDIYHPPGTGYASYPGAQGIVHVLPTIGPSAYWVMPVNIVTTPSAAQTFTTFYADRSGSATISDSSFTLAGPSHTETLHYNPASNTFTLQGAGGSCTPGQSATLSDGNLILDCSQSSVFTSGVFLSVTYYITPQPSLSGQPYQLKVAATEMGGATSSKTLGTWTINRTPSAVSCTPMSSTTPVGTAQTFVCTYSDLDGYQNIAAANLYLSGNGGVHNEYLHYLVAPNLFTMLGSNDICSPGQAKTLTSGYLTLNCATSSISGSGTTLTVNFRVTPQALSSGIQFINFSTVSDQAGGANAISAGSWQIGP
jgi:hypothetical protein